MILEGAVRLWVTFNGIRTFCVVLHIYHLNVLQVVALAVFAGLSITVSLHALVGLSPEPQKVNGSLVTHLARRVPRSTLSQWQCSCCKVPGDPEYCLTGDLESARLPMSINEHPLAKAGTCS